MKGSRYALQMVVVLAVTALLGGCLALGIGAAAGAAGLAYAEGALRGSVKGTPEQVVNAAQATLRDMGFTIQDAAADAAEGHVNGKTSNDRGISIVTRDAGGGTSDIYIRIGTFGDEALSRDIYNRIAARV
jgi:hypothetical protein